MKTTAVLAAALLVAASARADDVHVGYSYEYDQNGRIVQSSAYGYVDPFHVTRTPATFSVTNVPAGYKITDWIVADQFNSYAVNGWTSTGETSTQYNWADSSSSKKWLAVCFSPVNYTIVFETDGGTAFQSIGPYSSTSSVTLPVYSGTKAGYEFSHWRYGSVRIDNGETFTGNAKFGLGNADATVTLNAVWQSLGYTVTFDANGGTGGPGQLEMTSGTQNYGDISGNIPTRAGYVFTGWCQQWYVGDYTGTDAVWDSNGIKIDNTRYWDANGNWIYPYNISVYARWIPNQYYITTGVSGSGSVSPSAGSHVYAHDSQVDLLATPGSGWLFSRWQEDGSTENPRTVTVTGPATYTAIFTQQVYNVTFWYYDGKAAWVSETQGVPYNETAVPPYDSATNCPGRTFSGWQGSYSNVNSARDVEARYIVNNYNVRYRPNCEGSSGSMQDSVGQACYADWNLRQNQFSRPGYSFVEWNTAEDGSGARYGDGATVNNLAYGNGEDVFLYAQWAPVTYSIEFSGGRGSEGEMDSIQSVAYDVEVALPANKFTKPGCDFQHWTLDGVSYDDGATVSNLTTTAGATVTLLAVWDAPFWIEFDANGGTGTMDVQRFEAGESKALYSNEYARVGYAFAGWATNAAAAAALNVKYADGEVVHDIGEVAETNTLFAVWSTNTYYVAFDANGGTGETMVPQRFFYDQAQNLASNTYSRGELWRFGGWSNAVNGVVYADGASVSNLCTEADGTNTLFAVWEDNRTDLSKAMHCTNLQWNGVEMGGISGDNLWTNRVEAGVGYEGSGSCAEQKASPGDALVSSVVTNGTLTFWCRNATGDARLVLATNRSDTTFYDGSGQQRIEPPANGDWQQISIDIDQNAIAGSGNLYIKFMVTRGTVQIDQMTWTPEGAANPEPTAADRVEASGVSVADGQMAISFTGDPQFSYHLLATDSLAPANWYPYGETNVGAGAVQTLPVVIDAEHPQRFFKIETIQTP